MSDETRRLTNDIEASCGLLRREIFHIEYENTLLRDVETAALTLYRLIAHNGMTSAEQDARDDMVDALAALDAYRQPPDGVSVAVERR